MSIVATRKSGIFLAAAAAFALSPSVAAEARESFDGSWRVEAKAHAGKCSEQYTGFVRVAAGRVSGGFLGTSATGSVSKDGHLRLAIDAVRATGVLAGARGLGVWKSPTCSGSWIARRA